ncbi:unnamed protein product [Adineta ricciae]|uniref:C2H2-type domain-containing protein n=1 Tax=Adineta ricciae TaxID=249248 RepID=A0A814QSQ8_ADIRI|nr:unnamed protein product [Adineta ricciae]CAF1124386.1 unnamed protein product [Adineta ricciae]
MTSTMLLDSTLDTDGTAFICPECSFNGTSLPELISHLNETHGEETATKSVSPPKNPAVLSNEKRSRRKPAFSHQIISQPQHQSMPVFKQSNVDPGSIHFWNRVISADENDRKFSESTKVRDENVTHPKISPQRLIAPKIIHTPPTAVDTSPSFCSPSFQPIQKNFQCRICHLTYKNFHDCTAHIRRKHEISHAQAGRYVGKLDTDVPLPPSATGHYKIRLKVKSLPPQAPTTATPIENFTNVYQCKYCPYTASWLKDVSQHERQNHGKYSSFVHEDTPHSNKHNNKDYNDLSALLIDNVEPYNDTLPNPNDEIIMIEEDIDDDEEDALWKYQQELNNLTESPTNHNNNNTTYHHQNHPNASFLAKPFKKFQCPHCEHSSPKLAKLKLHIATHTNIKPYMCSICGWRANLRWYIQCHAKKRHPNQNFEVLQLSNEEAEQTINAYMRENGLQTKVHNRFDSKHHYQCSLCQFRSNHPRFIEQHIETNHSHMMEQNNNHSNLTPVDLNSQYSSKIVYPNFSSHPNFNPNRLYYCSLCYRGYRWRYDVKRHHKTMHETVDDEVTKGRNFHYLEYVPQIDSLITATMSSIHNPMKHENEVEDNDDDLKLSIADARTVDVTDEEAALLMIESEKSETNQIVIDDHPEDAVIVFEDDRTDKSTSEIARLSSRPTYKPFRCPYCFYRTNWRTDCMRHMRARHKVEPNQNGYYEMSSDEAERTYDEYERTFGFVVAKKVLARFTDFRQLSWEDLKRSIWEKIKDKPDFEQCIYDRLRPDDYALTPVIQTPAIQPIVITIPNKMPLVKQKRVFTCMDCAFSSHRIYELERHICSRIQKFQQEKSHGQVVISLYECTKCSYRTMNLNYAKQHIYLHQSKENEKKMFFYCSFCGYNHRLRSKLIVHIARTHPKRNSSNCLTTCRYEFHADFAIQQTLLKRSFIEQQLQMPKLFYCLYCPYISATILEHNQHRLYHQDNSMHSYKCQHCSFASSSSVYTNQHMLLHKNPTRAMSTDIDTKSLKYIPVSTICKEILGKPRRLNCPFCRTFASSCSSTILIHIKNTHSLNSKQFDGSLIIGAELAKEILCFEKQ